MDTAPIFAIVSDADEAAAMALDLHNKYRAVHDAPPLQLDSSLCAQAAAYALCIAKGMKPSTCDSSGLGRNIYRIQTAGPGYENFSGRDAIREAMTTWYGHAKDYNWREPTSSPLVAKLFSQVIWKSTESLGAGVATRTDDGGNRKLSVVVTLYLPAGNVKSDEINIENVRPRFSSSRGGGNGGQ